MNKKRNIIVAAGLVMTLLLSLAANLPVHAAKKTGLNYSRITVTVGKSKTIKVQNTSKKVTWNVLSGKNNISVTKGENTIKIQGKRAGQAKLQAKVGGEKYTCRITVTKKNASAAASGSKIAVKSSRYTVVYRLNDSQSAKDLYNQLPLTVKVENYSDNEKIFYPTTKLNTKGTPKSKGQKGSLAYYAPWGDVVMFYKAAGSASGLYELGSAISGGGNVSKLSGQITISRAD